MTSIESITQELVDKRNNIIPIIGNEMVVFIDSNGKEIPFQQHIIDTFAVDQDKFGKQKLDAMRTQSYYGLSVLANDDKGFLDEYCRYVKEGIKNGNIRLKRSVLDFLKVFRFPIIITTICFDIIEHGLNSKELFYPSKHYIPHNPKMDINGDVENNNLPDKCVYHLFGSAEQDAQDWVYDEEQLFFFLKSLNDYNYGAKGVANRIQNGRYRLLVLGCELPNWIFRFLLYPIQEKRKTRQGYWLNVKDPERSFETFLNDINYLPSKDIDNIIIKATDLFDPDIMFPKIENNHINHFDVFLSYASEDRPIAFEIYNILHDNHHLSVWMDKRGESEIDPGDPYWENIQEGIEKSDHYMPIVTEHFIEKLTNPKSNLSIETNMFRDYYDKKGKNTLKKNYSIPVIIKRETFRNKTINNSLVEQFGDWGILPNEFFFHVNGVEYDAANNNEFNNIDWKKTV